jgi:serine/threonine-protein kinase RsbW
MEKTIKIGSTISNFCKVEKFLNQLCNDEIISRKLYCKIFLSVSEAVNNAIIHGNQSIPDKTVSIHFLRFNDSLIFCIEDEGNGFDTSKVDDPRLADNLHKESGRGLFIMEHYSDKVEFFNKGNKVKLYFNI